MPGIGIHCEECEMSALPRVTHRKEGAVLVRADPDEAMAVAVAIGQYRTLGFAADDAVAVGGR